MTTKLLASLLIVLAFAVGTFAQIRGGAVWEVAKYDLDVALPQTFDGREAAIKATLDVKNISPSAASTLTLRISPFAKVSAVSVNGAAQDFSGGEEKLVGNRTLQRVVLRLPSVRASGTVKVEVTYTLTLKDNGDAGVFSPVGSHLLPLSFWYPTPTNWYYSRGADFAPFTVHVKAQAGMQVVSSGVEASGGSFETKSASQPFFAVGDWEKLQAGGVSVFLPKASGEVGKARGADLAAVFSEAKAFAEKFLGPGPSVPLKVVSVRRGAGFADAGVAFVDEAVFRRPTLDAATVQNVAEAAAKLTLSAKAREDGFGVISEGLSRFIANQFIGEKFGQPVGDAVRARQRAAYSAVVARDVPLGIVSPLDDVFFGEVANKGAMFWALLDRAVGRATLTKALGDSLADGTFTLDDVRSNFPTQKDLVSYFIEKPTEMNLLAGLPQTEQGETKVALRNSGAIDVTVNVRAITASGKALDAPVTLKATSFGEVTFKTPDKIVRTEIDTEKLYPQNTYFDDIAPKVFDENDAVAGVKSLLDQKKFEQAVRAAKDILRDLPAYDDVSIQLGRAYLGLADIANADQQANAVLTSKLPTAKSMAWAMEIRAEAAAKAGRNADALAFIEKTINFDGDYGASYAARKLRSSVGGTTKIDPAIKDFFARFDAASVAHKKAEVGSMVLPGEITRFAENLSGSAAKWQTTVTQVDAVGETECLVETQLATQLLTGPEQAGLAVFRMIRTNGTWRLAGVEIFEVN
ncbi:MAG TPA: hypothetical protein PKC89_04925 [Pyrinomonadaceae bacterium]|nr:hypothetical protein [Pyrinomonadaceae bacterium]